ncbi:MAG: arginine repressor [Clostridia bacterium]|nr:arginine repressor [Clostridia bacterium]
MNIKKMRQELLLDIIKNYKVSTQEELIDLLSQAGFEATQATVSRDIKQLHLVKIQDADGKLHYSTQTTHNDNFRGKIGSIIGDSVISVDSARNICIVKCHSGLANAACAGIDAIKLKDVVGTIAGDDTIFICCKSDSAANDLKGEILDIKNK